MFVVGQEKVPSTETGPTFPPEYFLTLLPYPQADLTFQDIFSRNIHSHPFPLIVWRIS